MAGQQKYRLVIFDMDGTLTEELLDFDAIRREIGLAAGGILEQVSRMGAAEKARAEEILHRHEMAGAQQCRLHEGAAETLAGLKEREIRMALLTRNSGACAETILKRHQLEFEWVATREHVPHKPHADSILNITRRLGVEEKQTLMVGDYLYDLQAARAAGVDSAFICVKGAFPAFGELATYRIRRLEELLEIVDGGRQSG